MKSSNAFTHTLSEEKIREFDSSTPEARLMWLEEAQQFVGKFVDPKKIERWKQLKGTK